jgi:hypothetical protein
MAARTRPYTFTRRPLRPTRPAASRKLAGQLSPGSLGENLSSPTLDESRRAHRRHLAPRKCPPAGLPAAQPVLEDRRAFRLRRHGRLHRRASADRLVLARADAGPGGPGDALALVERAPTPPALAEAMRLWEATARRRRSAPAGRRRPGIAAQLAAARSSSRADWLRNSSPRRRPAVKAFHVKPEDR